MSHIQLRLISRVRDKQNHNGNSITASNNAIFFYFNTKEFTFLFHGLAPDVRYCCSCNVEREENIKSLQNIHQYNLCIFKRVEEIYFQSKTTILRNWHLAATRSLFESSGVSSRRTLIRISSLRNWFIRAGLPHQWFRYSRSC
jgi:hypothetical protein